MSGRIENLSLAELAARSTSIVRAVGLGGGAFRIEAVLRGGLNAGTEIRVVDHAAWRSVEWERIFRERGVRKIMFHPRYASTLPPGAAEEQGRPLLLFLSGETLDGAHVLEADGALEDPAREAELGLPAPAPASRFPLRPPSKD